MPYNYSHNHVESSPRVFLSWLKRKDYELTDDDYPSYSLATLENQQIADIYYYNRSDTDLGLDEYSGIIALNDKGYVARLGLRDRNFIILEEAENVATDEELVKWLDQHASLTPDSPVYWNNEVLLSVLVAWCEENSERHAFSTSIEFPPEEAWPWWKDPEDPFHLLQAVHLTIHKQTPIDIWITQMANGRFLVGTEYSKQLMIKDNYDAVEEYLDTLI
jgi:hypothetical protein